MKIILCDDDLLIRTVVSTALEAAGHQAVVAVDGQEALEMIQGDSFDLLVTDKRMPRLNGIELVEKLRELKIPVKVVMASAFSHESDMHVQDRLQIDASLKKPFTKAELLECLSKLGG